MKLTDEIATAPFRFSLTKNTQFDLDTQEGLFIEFESVADPNYKFRHAIRTETPNLHRVNETGLTPHEIATMFRGIGFYLESRFNEDGTLKPEVVARIRGREDA